jgi:hypothetical protein
MACPAPRAIAVVALLASLSGQVRADFLTVTTVGNPTFRPVDFHLFSAPIGTAADGYAEFFQTGQLVLPEPYYKYVPGLGITPDQPHPGDDFTTDILQGVQANGFVDKTTFSASEFSEGRGVFLSYMVVPGAGAPVGSSPDFTSGPIIPNGAFPVSQSFDTFYGNGTLADSSGTFTLDVLHPDLDGESHIPFFVADNFSFMDPSKGIVHDYEYRISLRDASGNGYDIRAAFSVVPEPTGPSLLLLGLALPLAQMVRRRAAPAPGRLGGGA